MGDRFSHQLVYLLEPVGFLWLCLLVLTAALWWRRQRAFAGAAGAIALFVTVVGSSPVPGWLLRSLERPYAGVKIGALPNADAIILLGGGASPSRYEAGGVHLTPDGDRLVMAHHLFHLGKAPVLILGGNASKLDGVIRLEGEIVRDLLTGWGVPAEAMISLAASGDTHDEALKIHVLAAERGWKRVLLVTSANHMRRASAVVRAPALDVVPVPCNFLTTISTVPPPLGWSVPRAQGFSKMATWWHEEAGMFIYRRRGWITDEARVQAAP